MSKVPFSVIMSVYKNDNASYFDRALQSVTIHQTVTPDEIVLVVDGPVSISIDKVIEKYVTNGVNMKIIRLAENGGLGNALRIAIENTTYEYVARMDSDDISVPTRFEQQLRILSNNSQIDIVGGDISEFIEDEKNVIGRRVVPTANEDIRNYMKTRCAMNHVSVMYKKSSVQEAGGYQDLFWNEDYFLWIRMWMNEAVFANTGTVLVNVRSGEEQYQRRGGRQYFKSEKILQDLMLSKHLIGYGTYFTNVAKRYIVQILLPNSVRGWVFKNFARKH